jgi:hypothetical protein
MSRSPRAMPWVVVCALAAVACAPSSYTQSYFPAGHNWMFRKQHPGADALFNAFDYGHAIALEALYARAASSSRELESEQYVRLTRNILVHPPAVPLDGAAIAPTFAKLAPEALMMFEWAHMLHRQIYDVWADERLSAERKQEQIERVLRYYRSRTDLALSAAPKSMDIMEAQPYSGAFRRSHPRFNTLLWSYHWMQVAIYDALMASRSPSERRSFVDGTVARFRTMFADSPRNAPTVMPMSAAVAPAFAAAHPEAAIIFDNLHAMHDVVADVLASSDVGRAAKRRVLLEVMARFRDDSTHAITRAEWLRMSKEMGVENMGGVAIDRAPGGGS